MASVRDSYVACFGEEEAQALERAALEHGNGVNDKDGKGSDPFKWTALIAIGYQCAEKEDYREYHGIKAPWEQIKDWFKLEGDLDSHDGGFDYISLFAGVYDEYMPEKAKST